MTTPYRRSTPAHLDGPRGAGVHFLSYLHSLPLVRPAPRVLEWLYIHGIGGERGVKLLSIAIPSYNSQDYLAHAVESLLPGGDEVEILIVDDGSSDRTAQIADDYEARYPGIVRAIHKENGGHGDAVMAGLRCASGLYFKVVTRTTGWTPRPIRRCWTRSGGSWTSPWTW